MPAANDGRMVEATRSLPVSPVDDGASTSIESSTARVEWVLREGELELDGLLVESSNHAMVGEVRHDGMAIRCVYKPMRGERPLWDFPRGELARREVAAYLVANAAGWCCVPPTVFRDGPAGPGMVQKWVADHDDEAVAQIFQPHTVPEGWLPIFRAEGEDGNPLVVAHADTDGLRQLAVFDAVVNNADRKASHLLACADGAVLGVDHGLTFHAEPKLRTILWGWAGEPIPASILHGIEALADRGDALDAALADHLDPDELDALHQRIEGLRREPVFPLPPTDRYPIPWPPL